MIRPMVGLVVHYVPEPDGDGLAIPFCSSVRVTGWSGVDGGRHVAELAQRSCIDVERLDRRGVYEAVPFADRSEGPLPGTWHHGH